MTPAQIEASARNKYNATNDTFYVEAEIRDYIYQAQLELAQVCPIIEATASDVSVAGQADYDFPDYAIEVKRLTYDGRKLQRITFRDEDSITGLGQSTVSGTPEMYAVWNSKVYLLPTPDASALTIEFFTHNEPAPMDASSLMEVPTLWHMNIVDRVAGIMAEKDENSSSAARYELRWEKTKARAIAWCRKRKRADAFATVQTEEQHATTQFGIV